MEVSVSHNEGWNLVGLPLYTEDTFYQYLFPGSVSGTLYGFDGTYILEESLTEGNGYWLNFSEAGSTTISGAQLSSVTISLDQGWNLISGISEVVDVASISDPASVVVPGTVYGFTGTYLNTSIIDPGKGYWINASGMGDITISVSGTARLASGFTDRTKGANRLSFNGSDLYFGVSIPEEEIPSYQLPPKPPSGTFDVRFKNGQRLVNIFGEIEVINITEVITIAYDISLNAGEHMNWVLILGNGKNHILEGSGEVTVPSAERFVLNRISVIPITFALHQNFPNPFNPITTFRYDLPSDAFVTLSIYDMLGREITQLVSTTQEAGFRLVQWNGSDIMGRPVSAGVYLYQIRAGEFTQTRKMVLLK
jgi:hypothetical protein